MLIAFIILIQTKLKWSGLFDFDFIVTPKVELIIIQQFVASPN